MGGRRQRRRTAAGQHPTPVHTTHTSRAPTATMRQACSAVQCTGKATQQAAWGGKGGTTRGVSRVSRRDLEESQAGAGDEPWFDGAAGLGSGGARRLSGPGGGGGGGDAVKTELSRRSRPPAGTCQTAKGRPRAHACSKQEASQVHAGVPRGGVCGVRAGWCRRQAACLAEVSGVGSGVGWAGRG